MKKLLLGLVLYSTSALAQQPSVPPETQALQTRLMFEINASLQCSTENIKLSQQVAALQAEIATSKKGPTNAQQVPSPAPTDGSSSPQPEVRKESGRPAKGR